MRAIEAQRLKDYFIINGYKESSLQEANVVSVFTCSVVDETEASTLTFVESILGKGKRILLLGCSPGISPNLLRERFGFEMIPTKDLENLIDTLFPNFKIKFNEIPLPSEFNKEYQYGNYYLNQFERYDRKNIFKRVKRKPALLISSKGCNNNCSYCTMRRALGPVKSYSLENLGRNYKKMREDGFDMIIFNADDTGAFGIDCGQTFETLLDYCYNIEEQLKIGKVCWVIDNLHPMWAIKYQDTFLKYIKNKTIVEIVMPLQSASNRVLKLMKRKHNVEDVEKCIARFRDANAKFLLKTHFIIGFPTEDTEDINSIKRILKQKYFNHVILLKYYEGENSDSALIENKIPIDTVNERIEVLTKLLTEIKIEFYIAGTPY